MFSFCSLPWKGLKRGWWIKDDKSMKADKRGLKMTEGDDRMRRSMFWTWVFQSCPGGIAHSADSALLPTRPSAMDSPPACQICQICQVLWSWPWQMPPAGRCQRCPSPQRRARNTWNFHSVCVFSIDSIDFCKFKLCLQLQVGWQHAPKAPVGRSLSASYCSLLPTLVHWEKFLEQQAFLLRQQVLLPLLAPSGVMWFLWQVDALGTC